MSIAIISGTSITRSKVFDSWGEVNFDTPYGPVVMRSKGDLLVVNRHGFSNPLPPHRSNYRGYVHALSERGVQAALCITSVGSLQESLPPGTLVSCSDYMSFAPMTFVDDAPSGFAPEVDNKLLPEIVAESPFPIETDKIYAQTRGPRFETKAEVRILQNSGCDVVGMTLANEADLLLERSISVTSLCVIDNFAHGIGDEQLSMESFHEAVAANQGRIDQLLSQFVARFAK